MTTRKKTQALTPGQWEGIETKVYKTDGSSFKHIVRRSLIDRSNSNDPYEFRYFEIEKGGYSSLEKHEHTHTVIITRGQGQAIIGGEVFNAKPHDIFYVKAHEPHQFLQQGEEPFGFYCIVPKERDKPKRLSEAECHQLKKTVPIQF